VNDMHHDTTPTLLATPTSRRNMLRLGGLAAVAAALTAACSENTEVGTLGRVGTGSPAPELEEAIVNDGVLMRTGAGIEFSIANAYQRILESGALASSSAAYPDLGDQTDLVTAFHKHHLDAADSYNEGAVAAGEEAWDCGNARLDSAFLEPIFTRIEDGTPATENALEIPPSDDTLRDFINLVYALETLSAETGQAMVGEVSDITLRPAALAIASRSARQAAVVALAANPTGFLADPNATDEIPLPVALPTQFASLAAITYIGGAGDENGVRLKSNLETPSLNSFAYPFDECAAG